MRRCLVILLFAAWSLPLTGNATSAAPPTLDDILLTIKVRRLLYLDEELRPHNLGVHVVDRVAILFGPVSKIDLGLRAESRLRGLIELRDVRNELDVLESLPDLLPDGIPASAPVPGREPRLQRPTLGVVPAELKAPRADVTLFLLDDDVRPAGFRRQPYQHAALSS